MLEILEVRFDERVVGGELKHCESAWYQAARGWRSARAGKARSITGSRCGTRAPPADQGVRPTRRKRLPTRAGRERLAFRFWHAGRRRRGGLRWLGGDR